MFYSNTTWELRIHTYYGLLQNEKFEILKFTFRPRNGDGSAKKPPAKTTPTV